MASPVADKLALFADRFAARTDVYAVRWENRRTAAAGWMPAVAGGWRKGMNRHGRRSHVAGSARGSGRTEWPPGGVRVQRALRGHSGGR